MVWHSTNIKVPEIVEQLETENIMMTNKTIYLLLKTYKSTASVYDLPRSSRKKLNVQHYCFIDEALSQDNEITCTQLYTIALLIKHSHEITCIQLHEIDFLISVYHYQQLKEQKRILDGFQAPLIIVSL